MYQLFDRPPSPAVRGQPSREGAARRALALCETADAMAREAAEILDTDEDRLFALLEARDEMLQDLSEQLVILQQTRPTADNALFAATELAADEADAVIDTVVEAMRSTQRTTLELAARVAKRVEGLRAELAAIQRAGNAGLVYSQEAGATRVVDLRR